MVKSANHATLMEILISITVRDMRLFVSKFFDIVS